MAASRGNDVASRAYEAASMTIKAAEWASEANGAALEDMKKLLHTNEGATMFHWSASDANEAGLKYFDKMKCVVLTKFETASH